MNGRMPLPEAERVAALVAARSDDELKAATLMKEGRLATLADRIAESLTMVLALVEAGIDFTDEEDVVAISVDDLSMRLESVIDELRINLDRCIGLESLQSLPWVVLHGTPNAGKSTLFNALLGRSRAVVSEVDGTTRDVLAEPLRVAQMDGAEVLLIDAAGLDDRPSSLSQAMSKAT